MYAVDPDQILDPATSEAEARDAESATGTSGDGGIRGTALLLVTALLAVGGIVVLRQMRGMGGRLSQRSGAAIEICRMRSLGGRQHLVVVQVEGKRMLLGVGPGFITNLCELEPEDYSLPYERKGRNAPLPVQQTPEPVSDNTEPFSNLISRINESLNRPDGGHEGPAKR